MGQTQKLPDSTGVRTTLGLLPMIALSAAVSAPAFAQSAPANPPGAGVIQLDELSVEGARGAGGYRVDALSSPKATAPLRDTPQTVSVIPEQIIKERGARTLTEVLRNTPGISFNAGENGFATSTNNFQIRGFDASGSVYVDGVRDSGSYARDTFNVESVEVAKGAAADNGRGGPGGYVNLVTKTPTIESIVRGEASLSFDQYGTTPLKRATLDVNHAVNETIAVRLNAMGEDGGVMGRNVAESGAWGLAPSVAFGLGTSVRAILAYEHLERNDIPDWGVPGASVKGLDLYDRSTNGLKRDKFFGLKSDFDDVKSDNALARLEYDFADGMTISNQTRWSRVDRRARYTVPTGYVAATGQVTAQTQFYDRVNESLSNQTNLTAKFETGSFRHTVAAGVELTRETSEAGRFGAVNPPPTDLFHPNPGRAGGAPFNSTQDNEVEVRTIAAYLYDTVEINPQWQVTGGVRIERYKVEIDDSTSSSDYKESETTVTGKVGVVYKPVPEGSIYGSFGISALPPGSFLSNPDISRTGDNAFPGFVPNADPVRSYNYEVGVKWDFFGGALSTAVAAFRTEKHKAAIVGLDEGETGAASLKGYGKQIVQGVEVTAAGKITEAWSVFGGATVLKSKRKHSAYLDEVRRRANPADYGTSLSTNGDRLAFTPNFTANFWTTYDVTPKWTLGAGFQYVGSSYLGRPDDALRIIPNGQFGKLPSFFLVNATAAYKVTENVDVRLNVDNIFGERYAISSNWNGSRAALGAPRVFRISSSFQF